MVYTHHSHVRCDDCGEKHIPGNTAACIESLREQIGNLKDERPMVLGALRDLYDAVEESTRVEEDTRWSLYDQQTSLTRLHEAMFFAERALG